MVEVDRADISDVFRPSLLWIPSRLSQSAWRGHLPFAFWIVDVLRPRMVVELGTHTGVSYSAFCHAVKTLQLSTRCFAVDTWRGDEHAGFYPDRVFNDISKFNLVNYASFSTLIRSTFDAALEKFEDGSIDLLHIDGYICTLHGSMDASADDLRRQFIDLVTDENVRERLRPQMEPVRNLILTLAFGALASKDQS